jgi:hypothetical protein
MRPDRKGRRGWLGPAAWARREARAGDRLPYAAHLDPHTLRLRDGALMQALAVPGLPFETEDARHLDHMLAVRDVMLRSALDAGFVLYHHVVRRPVSVALSARFPDGFSAALDAAWQDQLAARQLFVNEQFLTLVRRPPRGKVGLLERFGRRMGGDADPALRRELTAAVEALLSGLAPMARVCWDAPMAARSRWNCSRPSTTATGSRWPCPVGMWIWGIICPTPASPSGWRRWKRAVPMRAMWPPSSRSRIIPIPPAPGWWMPCCACPPRWC